MTDLDTAKDLIRVVGKMGPKIESDLRELGQHIDKCQNSGTQDGTVTKEIWYAMRVVQDQAWLLLFGLKAFQKALYR